MKNNKTIKVPKDALQVRASFAPDSFDESNRTIEVVFSTGSKGKRGFWTEYFEELSMKKADVRLERLNAGAPVLDNHDRFKGLRGIIGVVEKAWIKNKEGIARIRFSEREEVQDIVADIQAGIIRNVSVGYKVHKYEDVSKKGDEIPTYRAVDWEPMEVSFVDIPFDMKSQSRSLEENETIEIPIRNQEECQMKWTEKQKEEIRKACNDAGLSEDATESVLSRKFDLEDLDGEIKRELATQEKRSGETDKVETEIKEDKKEDETRSIKTKEDVKNPEALTEDQKRKIQEEERNRANEIRSIGETLNLDLDIINEHCRKGTSIDSFRAIAIEKKGLSDQAKRTSGHNIEVRDMDNKEMISRGIENAILNKFDSKRNELTNDGKEFRFSRLSQLARKYMEMNGENTSNLLDSEVAERAMHSTSDFVNILANVANKSLRDAYELSPATWAPFVRETEVADFKEISRTQLHSGAGLSEVKENGEYEYTTLSESAEKYSIKEYGKIIALTRKTIINDDLNAFTRVPFLMGQKARQLESKLIYQIINSNPQMADGENLFSTAHGNLAGSGAAISETTVNAGFAAMEAQTDLDGELIDIVPQYLMGGSIQRATIKKFIASVTPNATQDVNPFDDLQGIVERRLTGNAWYLLASAMMMDMIEIARLEGQNGPSISEQEGFDVSGVKLKVQYDFGAKVLDWRGFYKNPGA